eukprot:scaffold3051_cov175-Amphora_coffeaeformis.AAC.3
MVGAAFHGKFVRPNARTYLRTNLVVRFVMGVASTTRLQTKFYYYCKGGISPEVYPVVDQCGSDDLM